MLQKNRRVWIHPPHRALIIKGLHELFSPLQQTFRRFENKMLIINGITSFSRNMPNLRSGTCFHSNSKNACFAAQGIRSGNQWPLNVMASALMPGRDGSVTQRSYEAKSMLGNGVEIRLDVPVSSAAETNLQGDEIGLCLLPRSHCTLT
jgi:hypothetical protein